MDVLLCMSYVLFVLFVVFIELVFELYVYCVELWCVIGSVGVWMFGVEVDVVDVDVLVLCVDVVMLMVCWVDWCDYVYVFVDGD